MLRRQKVVIWWKDWREVNKRECRTRWRQTGRGLADLRKAYLFWARWEAVAGSDTWDTSRFPGCWVGTDRLQKGRNGGKTAGCQRASGVQARTEGDEAEGQSGTGQYGKGTA